MFTISLYCIDRGMVDPQKIPLFRVKQAYGLNEHEAQSLLHELSPTDVFPYDLWREAYSAYWKYPAAECSRLYKVENPPFPEVHQITEKYFPTETYATWMMNFFFEMARRISVKHLKDGFDYIVASTYDTQDAVSEADREYLFYHLAQAEKSIANVTRVEGVKAIDVKLSSPDLLLRIFPDTIAVDKVSAIHYWSVIQKYPLAREVKGISQSLVDSVIKAAAQEKSPVPEAPPAQDEPAADMQPRKQKSLSLPRSLWDGKTQEFICAALREKGWDNVQIAHILFHKRGFTQKRAIARLLHDNPNLTDSAYDKYGKTLFEESGHISITDEGDS